MMARDYETAQQLQEIDFEVIDALIPFIHNKTFIDIGAKTGDFSKQLIAHNLTGILFEPFPNHHDVLQKLAKKYNCIFSPYAIDNQDILTTLHIACDENDKPLNDFHSLHRLIDNKHIRHKKTHEVTCRSLNSLCKQGTINKQVGIIKTATAGNDLHVLQGLSDLETEVLICDFFMPGIHAGWEQGNAYDLIAAAKELGFEHYIAIKNIDYLQSITMDNPTFLDKQWGKLIFIKNNIFDQAKPILETILTKNETALIQSFLKKTEKLESEIKKLNAICDERLELINHIPHDPAHVANIYNGLRKRISSLERTISSNEEIIQSQKSVIRRLQKINKEKDLSFIQDINTHFIEIYERFVEVQQRITRTSKEALYDLNHKYREMQNEKLSFIDPLIQRETRSDRTFLQKIRHRINLFFKPKLGELNIYTPRKMVIPARYSKIKSQTTLPKISIVTPSFNHGSFIERTIKSVIDQKYPHLEYIIQDGKSIDETVAILKKYSPHLKHWESAKDKGQSHAINLGFKHATGEIMAYLNSDDILLPGALKYVGNYFATHPEVDVVYGHRALINEMDLEIGRWVLPPHNDQILSWADYIPQETLFWRRSIWEKVGEQIDESFQFAMDWDLILRFRDAGAKFARLPRFIGAFRIHFGQKTSAQLLENGTEEMQRLRERYHGRIVTHDEIQKGTKKYLAQHVMYHKFYRLGLLRY